MLLSAWLKVSKDRILDSLRLIFQMTEFVVCSTCYWRAKSYWDPSTHLRVIVNNIEMTLILPIQCTCSQSAGGFNFTGFYTSPAAFHITRQSHSWTTTSLYREHARDPCVTEPASPTVTKSSSAAPSFLPRVPQSLGQQFVRIRRARIITDLSTPSFWCDRITSHPSPVCGRPVSPA